MVEKVSDFMAKGGVKRYLGGLQARRLAEKAKLGALTLAAAFCTAGTMKAQSASVSDAPAKTYSITEKNDTVLAYFSCVQNQQQQARLEKLVDNAMKTPTGAAVLREAARIGAIFTMDASNANANGFYDMKSKRLCLNPNCDDAVLSSTLIHEARHAVQYSNIPVFYSKGEATVASGVDLNRAMESDAQATQVRFAYEMKSFDNGSSYAVMQAGHPQMTAACDSVAALFGKDDAAASKAIALAWYKDKSYVTKYDMNMADSYKHALFYAPPEQARQMLTKTVSAETIAASVFKNADGKTAYMTAADLKTKETHYMDDAAYASFRSTSKVMEHEAGVIDRSVETYYKYDSVHKTLAEKTEAQTKTAATVAVAKAVKGR